MDLLKIIKSRKTTRRYSQKKISGTILNKIIEAGRWGPSIVNAQPFLFIVISNKKIIQQIAKAVVRKASISGIAGGFILHQTAKTIANSQALIAVYNTGEFHARAKKINKQYSSIAELSEVQATSGAIQNMILMAESLDVGSCWQDTPLLCEGAINRILEEKRKLIAILSLGYKVEEGLRAKRKKNSDVVRFLK